MQHQVARLQGQATQPPDPIECAEMLETLSNALEELQVTQEELERQAEQLMLSRQDAEAQRQRYEELFQSAPEAYLVSDAHGVVEEANRAATTLLGIPTHLLVGKPIFAFVVPEDRRPLRQGILSLAAGQGSTAADRVDALPLRLRPRRSSPIDAEATVAAARDAEGTLVALRWFLRDVQARRRQESERLRAGRDEAAKAQAEADQEKVASILESVTDAFFALDEHWRFTFLNPQAERLLSRTREELLGRNIWDEFPKAVGSAFDREYHRAAADKVPVLVEEFYPSFQKWFAVRAFPAEHGLSVFFLDVTERRQAEQAKQEEEARQRAFVRDVLASVTEGRLRLCDQADQLPAALPQIGGVLSLTEPEGSRALRRRVREAADACGLPQSRADDLGIAVGEAGMNAVVHGRHGQGCVCANVAGTVQVWITDEGQGIAIENLPKATLERGWSSAGTAGFGFKMILSVTDRLSLLTGSAGTTVVIEQDRAPVENKTLQPA